MKKKTMLHLVCLALATWPAYGAGWSWTYRGAEEYWASAQGTQSGILWTVSSTGESRCVNIAPKRVRKAGKLKLGHSYKFTVHQGEVVAWRSKSPGSQVSTPNPCLEPIQAAKPEPIAGLRASPVTADVCWSYLMDDPIDTLIPPVTDHALGFGWDAPWATVRPYINSCLRSCKQKDALVEPSGDSLLIAELCGGIQALSESICASKGKCNHHPIANLLSTCNWRVSQ